MQNISKRTRIIEVSDKMGHFLEIISGAFSVLFFAAMTIVTLVGVVARYVMLNPFSWTEESARFLMLCLCFLSINIALRKREHIAIQTLVQRLPPRISKVLDYCTDLLIGFFLIILIKQGYFMTTRTLLTASMLNISMSWVYLFVPLGAFLTLLQLILEVTKKTLSES